MLRYLKKNKFFTLNALIRIDNIKYFLKFCWFFWLVYFVIILCVGLVFFCIVFKLDINWFLVFFYLFYYKSFFNFDFFFSSKTSVVNFFGSRIMWPTIRKWNFAIRTIGILRFANFLKKLKSYWIIRFFILNQEIKYSHLLVDSAAPASKIDCDWIRFDSRPLPRPLAAFKFGCCVRRDCFWSRLSPKSDLYKMWNV